MLYKVSMVLVSQNSVADSILGDRTIVWSIMSASLPIALLLALATVLCNAHVLRYRVKGDVNGIPFDVDISLEGNTSSVRLAAPGGDNCNCCQRQDDMEERLASLTLLMEGIQNRIEANEKSNLRSCQNFKKRGFSVSGVYTVDIGDGLDPFSVYCDMTTDGGGWTVFQRRQDGSIDFHRNWTDYKNGFGDLNGEFWLGLDKIHRLTKVPPLLRIDLGDFDGNKRYAKYTNFVVENESRKYAMTFSKYTGNAGDSFSYHKGMMFSTEDNNNDQLQSRGVGNCAKKWQSGWWYKKCHYAHLNGEYSTAKTTSLNGGVVWYNWKRHLPLKFVEMKLRPSD